MTRPAGHRHYPARTDTRERKVLVILSNRFNRAQKPRYVELKCDEKGNILGETPLTRQPKQPVFDEVWENDEGRTSLSSSYRIKRHYKHALIKAKD